MMLERGKVRPSTLDRAIVRDSIRLAGLSFEAGILAGSGGSLGWFRALTLRVGIGMISIGCSWREMDGKCP